MNGRISEIVEDMRRHLKDGVVEIKELSEAGVPIVGTYCTYMPWEIIHAAGAVSVSLCAKSEDPIAAAEEHLPRNLCPLIKASYGHALKGTCPYFHFCRLIIAESTCDGKKKMYELLDRITPVHMLEIPQSAHRPEGLAQMKSEFLRVRTKMEELVGHEISDARIASSIRLKNRERAALRNLWELSALDSPPLSGLEMHQFTEYMQYHFDKEESISWLEDRVREIRAAWEAGDRREPDGRPRILVTGCPVGGVVKVIEAVENAGGVIVCYENCGGQKELGYLVDETKAPMDALAEKYLSIGCSVMSPNRSRMDSLAALIERYRIDGVVELTLTACHTYAVEAFTVRTLVRSLGKSYINVDTDYSESDRGQLATRLGAFMEML